MYAKLFSMMPFFIVFVLQGLMMCGTADVGTETPVLLNITQDFELEVQNASDAKVDWMACSNTTFDAGEYEIFPNDSIHVAAFDWLLNNETYIKTGDSVVVCTPEGEFLYQSIIFKPLYFAFLTFLFQFQVPILLCIGSNLSRSGPFLLAMYFACLVGSYFIIPVNTVIYHASFLCVWVSLPSLLNIMNLSSVAWLTLLTSDVAVAQMSALGYIGMANNDKVMLKAVGGILRLAFCVAFALAGFTYTVIRVGMIEQLTGLKPHFVSLEKMLPYFSPLVFGLTLANLITCGIGYRFGYRALTNDPWLAEVNRKNSVFFNIFMFLVATYCFGCGAVVFELWWSWNVFAVISLLTPFIFIRALYVSEKPVVACKPVLIHVQDGKSTHITVKLEK